MKALEPMPSHPDDGTCDLYIHIKPANTLQDLSKLFDWLCTEFNATPVLPNSFYIAAADLYEENNVDSFIADLTDFLDNPCVGTEIVICPVSEMHQLSFCSDDPEQEPEVCSE